MMDYGNLKQRYSPRLQAFIDLTPNGHIVFWSPSKDRWTDYEVEDGIPFVSRNGALTPYKEAA